MVVMNIPSRPTWYPGLQKVEQDTPFVFVGSRHHCTFQEYLAMVSPLRMTLSGEGILYAESCQLQEPNHSLVYEFVFKKVTETSCFFAVRCMNAGETQLPKEVKAAILERMQQMAQNLKTYCETVTAAQPEPMTASG